MPAGRPKKIIDKDQFEDLCKIQCTLNEIASFFDCSEDHIENWVKREYKENFSDVFGKKRGTGKVSLRRTQWQEAHKGNTALLIFLGKQFLGQADKVETNLRSTDGSMSPQKINYGELTKDELKQLNDIAERLKPK
jgi:hypothetical protein